MQTNKVEHLKRNKKLLILICVIEVGIITINEIIEEKHNEEKPIRELIRILFSIDYFSLILFLLMQAYSFHHVLHKL